MKTRALLILVLASCGPASEPAPVPVKECETEGRAICDPPRVLECRDGGWVVDPRRECANKSGSK